MTEKELTNGTVLSQHEQAEHEQELLDTALLESDQLLARSLHDDEARRKRKRLAWLSALVIGGVVMSVVFIGILAGWFAVAEVEVAQAGETKSGIAQAEAFPGPTDEQWQTRLLALKEGGSWFDGAQVGMELVRIPGDRPYEILKTNWPKIATSARKQILKGFTPGMMGNQGIHARFFDVMHLGMTDLDADVRSFAATYIEMQGLPNFKEDAKEDAEGYAQWWEQNKDRPAVKIIAKEDSEEDPTSRGWAMFSKGRMKVAERFFRKAIKNDPDDFSALNGLGFVVLNQGDHQQAKPMFEKCLEENKDAGGPMNGLARCLKAEGKVDEAIVLWEKMAKKFPGPTAATSGLAKAHLERKEYTKAIKYYKILTDSAPDNKAFQRGLTQAEAGLAAKQ